MADLYANYAALAAATVEGTDYVVRRKAQRISGPRVMQMTIHGGGIEGVETMPRYLADKYGWGTYRFEGIRSSGNADLHITSTNFDEPRCLRDLEYYERVLCWHGMASTTSQTILGGLDIELRDAISSRLTAAGFSVTTTGGDLLGTNPANIVNKGRLGAGVQLELSSALRDTFYTLGNTVSTRGNPANRSAAFFTYCDAVAQGIKDVTEPSPAPLIKSGEPADQAEMLAEITRKVGVGDVQLYVRRNGTSASTTIPAGAFTTYPLDEVVTNIGRGTYSTSTYIYTIPKTGLYLCNGGVRAVDGAAARSFAIGIGTSNADADFVYWNNLGGTTRPGCQYTRLARFKKGDQVRMFIYSDGQTFATHLVSGVASGQYMSLVRIAD